ncbi:MAG: DUF5666 domain-containing protein [Thermomicrobiales bacterium]
MKWMKMFRIVTVHGRRWARPSVLLLVVALAILGTLSLGAENLPAPPNLPPINIKTVNGTVTTVGGGTITVKQADGTTATVNVNDKTGYQTTVASAVSNVKVGDMVAVKGDKTGDNARHARALTIMGAPTAFRVSTGGKGDKGPGIAISGALPGDTSIGIAISGTAQSGGDGPVSRADGPMPVNQPVIQQYRVNGMPGDGPPDGTLPVLGKVTSVSGNTVTLQEPDNTTITVTTDAQTIVHADQQSSLSAIKAGDTVTIGAAKATDGTLTALFVNVGALKD